MTENNYDWSKFILRVNINNSAQSIYDAWTSKAQLENWFLRRAEIADKNGIQKAGIDKINEGDNYLWYWYGYSDADTEKGIFTKANGKDEIAFTFGIAGTVKVNIRDEGSYRMVELTQEDIPITEKARIDYHLGCTKGWLFYLTNLKSILEGGLDLRNKDENIKGVITA